MAGLVEGDFQWSPDGQWVAYRADQRVDEMIELFASRPDGSFNKRVSGPLVVGGDVRRINDIEPHYDWSADGKRLVYLADQVVDERFELFVAAPDGNAINASLSGTLTGGGNVFFFALE